MNDAEQFKLLYDISRTLHQQAGDLQRTLQTLMAYIADALHVKQGCLITFTDHSQIDHVYVLGVTDKTGLEISVWETMLKRGAVGYVYHSDRAVVVRNILTDLRWTPLPELNFLPKTGSALSLPLSNGNHKYGVLLLSHPEVDYFTRSRAELLEEIAGLTSIALANALELQTARTGDVRYHVLFDGAVVPIILTDLRGVIQDVNEKACDFLGYPRGALLDIMLNDIHAGGRDTFNSDQLLSGDTVEASI